MDGHKIQGSLKRSVFTEKVQQLVSLHLQTHTDAKVLPEKHQTSHDLLLFNTKPITY